MSKTKNSFAVRAVFFLFLICGIMRDAQANCPASSVGEYYMTYDSGTSYMTACAFGNSLNNVCSTAGAACTTPGALEYDSVNNVMRYCKDTNWANIDCFDSGVSCVGSTASTMAVNSNELQYCNGTNWMNFVFNGICSGIGVQEAIITPATAGEGEATTFFAWENSIGMNDDFAIVGQYFAATAGGGSRSGAATLYQRSGSTWTRVKELSRSNEGKFEYFGDSVDMSGNYAAISTYYGKEIYIYKKDQGGVNNWGELKRIYKGWYTFGSGLDIDGDRLIVGAPFRTRNSMTDAGGIVIYRKDYGGVDNWGEVAAFNHPVPAEEDRSRFGYRPAISGDIVAAGAYGYDPSGYSNAGAVYLYQETSTDNWTYFKKLVSPNGYGSYDYYGYAVSLDDLDNNGTADRLAVGAHGDDTGAGDAGAIFIYERDQGGVNNWGLVDTITLTDAPESNRHMGWELKLIGDRVIVSSRLNDDLGLDAGAVLVFEKNTGGANSWGLESTVYASDGDTLDEFSRSLAASDSGNYMIVGAPYKNNGSNTPGQAYTYNLSGTTWNQQSILTPNTSVEYSVRMGDYVSVSGDYLATGSIYKSTLFTSSRIYASGGVSIFTRNSNGSWSFMKEVVPINPTWGMQFGSVLQITPTILAVSVPGDDTGGNDSGGAHIYGRDVGGANNWGFVKELKASDAQSYDNAGSYHGLSLSGDYVALGARLEDGTLVYPNKNAGAAYVFKKDSGGIDNWGEIKAIKPPVEQNNAQFGATLDMGGQYLAIGAPYEDTAVGNDAGKVYLYERDQGGADNWGDTGISFEGEAANDQFGISIAIAGYTLAIGARYEDTAGYNRGAVYIYEKDLGGINNWGLRKKITYPGASSGDAAFGNQIDLAGDVLIVGAYFDDTNGTNAGMVYVYSRDEGGTDNWGLLSSIQPDVPQADDNFGQSVAVSGNVVAAGGVYIDDTGIDDGGVYVFGCPSGTGPNAYDFTNITGAAQSTWIASNIVTITGLSGPVNASVSGDGTPQLRVNGGAWVNSDTVNNNDTLQLRLLTGAAAATGYTAISNVNGVTDNYTVTTAP